METKTAGVNTHFIDSNEKLDYLINYIKENSFEHVVFDTETNSAEEKLATLYGIGVYFGYDDAFYVVVRDKAGNKTLSSKLLNQFITECLLSQKLIAHNGIYDILVIKNNTGIDLTESLYHDTILSKHLIDEERPFGLKEVGVKYLGAWADVSQKELYDNIKQNGGSITKDNVEMYKADTEVLGRYCCVDTIITYKLFQIFNEELDKQNLRSLYDTEVMPLYKLCVIPMKDKGFPIDIAHFEKLKHEIEIELIRLEREISEYIKKDVYEFELELIKKNIKITKNSALGKLLIKEGVQDISWDNSLVVERAREFLCNKEKRLSVFNITSNHHLSWLFFTKYQIKPTSFTEKGAPQLNAETLDGFSGEHPFADKIIEYKKLQKLLSTYIIGALDKQVNGVIYASFLMFGTTSGRFSCTGYNLQNLPRIKDDDSNLSPLVLKYTNQIKEGFIAPKGYKIVNADQEALEPKAFAEASGDKKLQQVFIDRLDLYCSIAIETFGLSDYSANKKAENYLKNHKPEARQKAKVIALACVYGAGAGRIAQILGCEYEEAQKIIDDYLDAYPDLKKYMETCDKLAMTKGLCYTKFGRVRHLPLAKDVYTRYGKRLLEGKWAKMNGLSELRYQFKNCLNNAKNFPIQGVAAHIINRAMIEIMKEFKKQGIDGYICAQVHDEITCIVREDQAEQAARIVQDKMENTTKISVPLQANPLIANNWAEAK